MPPPESKPGGFDEVEAEMKKEAAEEARNNAAAEAAMLPKPESKAAVLAVQGCCGEVQGGSGQ